MAFCCAQSQVFAGVEWVHITYVSVYETVLYLSRPHIASVPIQSMFNFVCNGRQAPIFHMRDWEGIFILQLSKCGLWGGMHIKHFSL
jgi:hypothetical protein